MRLVAAALVALVTLDCAIPPARAQTGGSPAGAPIVALDTALLAAMKSGRTTGFQARMDALAPAVDAAFDLPGILAAAVGPRWAGLPAPQQQALLASFRRFTIASYAANFDSFAGQTIAVVPPPRAVGADQLIQTAIVADGKSNRIDYQMRQIGGAWKAVDVLLDGTISNVAVQRSDFRHLLAGGSDPAAGAQTLIASLDRKTADLQAEAQVAPAAAPAGPAR